VPLVFLYPEDTEEEEGRKKGEGNGAAVTMPLLSLQGKFRGGGGRKEKIAVEKSRDVRRRPFFSLTFPLSPRLFS